MPRLSFFAPYLVLACTVTAQVPTISTLAGGGSNNVPALSAAIGLVDGVIGDAAGNWYFSASDRGRVFQVNAAGVLTVVAGTGAVTPAGDGCLAINATLGNPGKLALDPLRNYLYINDGNALVIRRVALNTGTITTVAGFSSAAGLPFGQPIPPVDGIPAIAAALGFPQGVAVDSAGNLYVSDNFNSRIRRVDINTGLISTYAGSGVSNGFGGGPGIGFAGDGGPATSASLNGPYGIAFDAQDNLFIADSNNNRIRRVDRATQTITTVAGGGPTGIGSGSYGGDGLSATSPQALMNVPQGVWVDGNGTIYIADSGNNRIRKVLGGVLSTLAGTGATGVLNNPLAVWANSSGTLVLAADTENSVLRNITVGSLTVVAGNGSDGSSGDSGPPAQASFEDVLNVASDGAGNLYVLDGPSAVLRKISATGSLSTIGLVTPPGGCVSDCFAVTGMAADASGNVYIADYEYLVVLKVDSRGNVTTLAGQAGQALWSGDGGPAANATFAGPYGLAVDPVHGYLYISDQGIPANVQFGITAVPSHVRRISLNTNPPMIASVAGSGVDGYQDGPAATAQISGPGGIAVDSTGNVYFSDQQGQLIREILFSGGNVATVAGAVGSLGSTPTVVDPAAQDGMPALGAAVNAGALTVAGGNLYFQSNGAIRQIQLATGVLGTVVAPTEAGFSGDGGPALCAAVSAADTASPNAFTTDAAGDLIFADGIRVRDVSNPANAPLVVAASVQVTTDPDFLAFSVDGAGYSSPQSFQWTPGSSHSFSAAPMQIVGGVSYTETQETSSSGVTVGSTLAGPYCSTNYKVNYSSVSSCNFSLNPYDTDAEDFDSSGGAGGVEVGAGANCPWSVSGLPAWITATSPTSFTSGGAFTFTVQPNTGAARSAVLSIAGFPFTVAQPCGASCTYSINPTSTTPSSAGGSGSVTVTCSAQTCIWTAASNATWISITGNTGGEGNGTVSYTVAPNTGAARTGSLTIAGQTFIVNQVGTPSTTIQTVPAGLQFTVDGGAAQTAPQTLSLTLGSHTVAVAATQTGGAAAGTQYVFSSWSDGGAASHTINIGSAAATYTATFNTQYQLTLGASPAAGGTVSPATGGFYTAASVVNITATPNAGYQFSGWTGGVASSTSASTTVTMSAPETVVANFAAAGGITIVTSPPGLQFSVDGGAVQTAPQTLNLSQGSHTIAVGAIQAVAVGTQYVFTSWSDGGAASHTIIVGSSAATYTATFKTQYQLIISASPAAGGTVSAAGGFYDPASVVNVTATPSSGYQFSGWTGSVASASSASTTVTMSAPETVVANFSSLTGITIQTSPPGLQFTVDGGAAQTAPQVLNLAPGNHTLAAAATQAVVAGTQYVFTSWSDGGAISHTIIVGSSAATYTATFKTQYQLTISASPAAGGTVSPASGGFYDPGSIVSISAAPASGYVFTAWVGAVASASSASTSVTMSAAETVVASFAGQGPPAVTVFSPSQGATGVSLSTSLTWGSTAGAASYDVYFGTTATPPFVTNTINLTYTPTLAAGTTYYWSIAARNTFGATPSVVWSFSTAAQTTNSGLRFVPVVPCRIIDTRNATGTFGGPALAAGGTRSVPVPQSACGIPSTALAYSLNVTAVPPGPLTYLTVWPTGQPQPNVSTLNSFDGRIVANAAIVPAGTGGAISLFASDATNAIVDINGYFAPTSTSGSLSFYAATPCRVADTRNAAGAFGGPFMSTGSTRSFPIPSSACGIPSTAQAYSFNVTAVPHKGLGYLTIWPAGQSQPNVSTLNSLNGAVVANAAIVPAGASGAVSVYVTDDTDVILDINGYFAPPGTSGLALYTVTPCRIADTRSGSGTFGAPGLSAGATRNFPIPSSACSIPATAQAYALNVTVVPPGPLTYLSAWPAGQPQPVVSTLNAFQGQVVANAAIVPAGTSGAISIFVSDATNVILDVNGYFAQ